MSSALLVQRPREEAQLSEASLEFGIASVESRIDSISLSRTGGAARASTTGPFEFDVELSELGRTQDSLSFRYSYTFGRRSCGQVCKIGGKAVVRLSESNVGRDFQTLGDEMTHLIVVEIFRQNYETAYLLHRSMSMEPPSPWITQDVCLSSRNPVVDATSDNP